MARITLRRTEQLFVDDASSGLKSFDIDVSTSDKISVQVKSDYAVTGAWTVVAEQSNNGLDFFAFASAVSFTADGISAGIDVSSIGWVRVRVSVVGTAGTVTVYVTGKAAF